MAVSQENGSNTKLESWNFFAVTDPSVLLPILKERHPVSCMMQNQVVQYQQFKDEMTFYTIGEQVKSDTWIISNNIREDYGCNYVLSAPVAVADGKEKIPEYVKECLSNGGGLIKWNMTDDIMIFSTLTLSLSNMMVEISAGKMGNITEIHPGVLYFMERGDALKLEVVPNDPSVEVRKLLPNESEFLLKNWKYTVPGSSEAVVYRSIEKSASGGVFVDGKLVSGVNCPAIGFLSALYTLREFRNKGYAKLVMKYTFKEYAKDGCIVCLNVERQNPRSMQFHESLGMKIALNNYSLLIKKLDVD